MVVRTVRWTAAVVVLLSLAWAADWTLRNRSYPDEKKSLVGVPNFGRLKPNLYRGGQPSSMGFANLRAIGVDTVISFTLGEEGARVEAGEVRKLGMDFISLPWSTMGVPDRQDIDTFLNYLRDHPDRSVFVHCKAGSDRTGTMLALSRIAIDGWPARQAVDEMEAFHFHAIFLPHLKRFVENFQPPR